MKFKVKCINSVSDECVKVIKKYEDFVKYLHEGNVEDIILDVMFVGDMFELEDMYELYNLEISDLILGVKIGKWKFNCKNIKAKTFQHILKGIYKNLDGHDLNLTVKFTTQLKGKI